MSVSRRDARWRGRMRRLNTQMRRAEADQAGRPGCLIMALVLLSAPAGLVLLASRWLA